MDRSAVIAALSGLKPRARDIFEVALPVCAGTAYSWSHHGPLDANSLGLLAGLLLVVSIFGKGLRDATLAALLLGALPVIVSALTLQPKESTLYDPVLWCIATPFAMWCLCHRLLERPSAQARMVFLLANTAAVAVLVIPVIGGRIHWGIVVLPFAVFRVATNAADKIRVDEELLSDRFASDMKEAREIATRIQWIGGAWVAGWAGVMP